MANLDLLNWALDNGAKQPTNLRYSEGLYSAIQEGNQEAAQILYARCTDPFEFCLDFAETSLEVFIQIRELGAVNEPALLQRSRNSECSAIFSYLSLVQGSKL